jgi:hypothetical protein
MNFTIFVAYFSHNTNIGEIFQENLLLPWVSPAPFKWERGDEQVIRPLASPRRTLQLPTSREISQKKSRTAPAPFRNPPRNCITFRHTVKVRKQNKIGTTNKRRRRV